MGWGRLAGGPCLKVTVEANWDGDASVWVAVARDDIGLVTEARTIEALQQKLAVMIPEILGDADSQFEIELIARNSQMVAA